MKTLLLATAASALFVLPAFAQTQAPTPPIGPTQQTQPLQHQAKPAIGQPMQRQASATMQDVNPNTLSRDQVQKIQQALDKSGFGAGQIDGMWGPETQAALQKFQKSKAMSTANGQLDRTTLSALQLNPNKFAQSQGMRNGAMAPQQAKQIPGSRSKTPATPAAKTP